MSIDMDRLVFAFLIMFPGTLYADSCAEEWQKMTKVEKYHYVIGYIDGQLARNDTIPNVHAKGTGYVHIPDESQVDATIDQIGALYQRSELKDVYRYKLIPEALKKVKNPDYDLEPWIEGVKRKLITSKGN